MVLKRALKGTLKAAFTSAAPIAAGYAVKAAVSAGVLSCGGSALLATMAAGAAAGVLTNAVTTTFKAYKIARASDGEITFGQAFRQNRKLRRSAVMGAALGPLGGAFFDAVDVQSYLKSLYDITLGHSNLCGETIEKFQDQLDRVNEQLKAAKEKLASTAKELKDANDAKEALTQDNEALKKQNKVLWERNTELADQNAALRAQNADLLQDNAELQEQLEEALTPETETHVVVPGDSLWKLAAESGGFDSKTDIEEIKRRMEEIIALNVEKYPSLADKPWHIEVGWELEIPKGADFNTQAPQPDCSLPRMDRRMAPACAF